MKLSIISVITFGAVSCYAGAIPFIGTQCTNGPIQCCNQLQNYNEIKTDLQTTISNFVGGDLQSVLHGQFGIDCTAVAVAGASGIQCNQQTVCCQDVDSKSLIGISCSPVNVNG